MAGKAAAERNDWMVNVLVDPAFDALRDDQRFDRIMRGAGLVPLARAD